MASYIIYACVVNIVGKENSDILKHLEQNQLVLSYCKITDKGIDIIIEALHRGVSLKECYITNTSMSATGAGKLFLALTDVSSLKTLEINNIGINDIKAIVNKNCSIKELNISNNNFVANGVAELIQTLSDTVEILDISSSFRKSNSENFDGISNLIEALLGCHSLKELDISHNHLTFDNVLQIAQVLRGHPNLKLINLNGNITSYILECEFLIDIILSVNQLLENVNVCGRNIRPRFNDDCLFSPSNQNKNSKKFALQNLYFTQIFSISELDSDQPTNYTKLYEATEPCPVANKSIAAYYVDHNGGTFYNQRHDFAIVIPPGAVSHGECVEIQANASWFNFYNLQGKFFFYKIPYGCYPISSFFWLSADYKFKIPVYLILSHYAAIRTPQDIKHLSVLHGCIHDPLNSEEELIMMKNVSSGFYFDDKIGYCVVATDHFCSFCMTNNNKSIPNTFSVMIYTYYERCHFVEVCFCPAICDCREVTSICYYN